MTSVDLRDRIMTRAYLWRLNARHIFFRTPLRTYNTGVVLGGLAALATAAVIVAVTEAVR